MFFIIYIPHILYSVFNNKNKQMQKKYKMTGFARFIIFMMFFAPMAYIGASYYNGEDGIQKIKDLYKSLTSESTEQIAEEPQLSKDDVIKMQEAEILMLKKKIQELESQMAGVETQQ